MKIKGFLHTEGKKILDGSGEEVILTGWGVGNWLLQEGYMWQAFGERFDRPRRIERVIEELTGKEYADQFWKSFRQDYVRQEDINYMAKLGYNSVRIPMNWRVFMEEGPGIHWKEEGFTLLDHCLNWCEEAGIYAFLDLHGAPGGQTGANIDDCVDDEPRLYIDSDSRKKAIALWKELAARYSSREVVGGYDLLNEPIAPPSAGSGDHDYLIPELEQFYRDVIREIRKIDKVHLLSIEGPHWATETCIFREKYDDNMVLHFHRYAENPERRILDAFLAKSEEWNIPLWLGETGENLNEWYAALYPLCVSLGFGYNLWPWKKMECTNSPCSIKRPEEYDKILTYIHGGAHPGFEKAQNILNQYLENIRLENCSLHEEVTRHVFRQAPFTMRATDFDEMPGKGSSFSGTAQEDTSIAYRTGCGMLLEEAESPGESRFGFDCGWDHYALVLTKGEFAEYTVSSGKEKQLELVVHLWGDSKGTLSVSVEGMSKSRVEVSQGVQQVRVLLAASQADSQTVRITGEDGCVRITRLGFTEVE